MQQNIGTGVARRAPRQQRSKAKVEAILAAVEAIAAEDPGDLTTSSIAKRAGISVGSLYQYFENREDIVDRLLANYRQELNDLIDKTFANDLVTSVRDALVAATRRYMAFVREHPAFRTLWYSPEFPNRHRIVDDIEDHALASAFTTTAYRYGLIATMTDPVRHRLLASWLALDAVIDAAFRLEPDGDQAMLDQAARIAAAV